MTSASFIREKVIAACEQSIRDIFEERHKKMSIAMKALAVFEKKVSNRSYWEVFISDHWRDTFKICNLKDEITLAEQFSKNHENRLIDMIAFCNKLATTTMLINLQEFKDFGHNYPDIYLDKLEKV